MSNQQIISKFFNKTFSTTKEDFLRKENITEDFFKENNYFLTCFGNQYQSFKLISFYVDSASNILFNHYKSIPNKKFIAIKMPSKEQREDLHRNNVYNFEEYKIKENELLSTLNPELSILFSCCSNFNLLALLHFHHIPKEHYDDLIYFINNKINIDNF